VGDQEVIAGRFEAHRPRLRAVAYRMLGSLSEADDAVQEVWLRLSRTGADGIENLNSWLTTVVGSVCIDMLRMRNARREEPYGPHVPEPIVSPESGLDPEHEALLADSVGLALLVVLEELTPAERLAFVLHDMFGVPFSEIAAIVDRSPDAARQLASRGRRRVRSAAPQPDADPERQRELVAAFISASRDGAFDTLVEILHPDVVLRVDRGTHKSREIVGSHAVAEQARSFARLGGFARPALVNGAAGFIVVREGVLLTVAGFTIVGGRITEINLLADADRLSVFDVASLRA
jgi:RNA polymerase sigma-70 factor, ECF subfamily